MNPCNSKAGRHSQLDAGIIIMVIVVIVIIAVITMIDIINNATIIINIIS